MAKFELLNRPGTLYRYRALSTQTRFEREIDVIAKGQLHFSFFNDLNDPMEGLSRRSWVFKHRDVNKTRYDKIVRRMDEIGVCSLSDTYDNEVMWAHYSGYSGICIGYRTTGLLAGLDDECSLVRVQYVDRSPMLTGPDASNISRAARKILSFKNSRWQYEREWRLLSTKTGLQKISAADCIVSIRMGSKIKRAHRKSIMNVAKKFKDVGLYAMSVRSYEHEWREL